MLLHFLLNENITHFVIIVELMDLEKILEYEFEVYCVSVGNMWTIICFLEFPKLYQKMVHLQIKTVVADLFEDVEDSHFYSSEGVFHLSVV